MLPGPDQVIARPRWKGSARHMTLRSGNTFGARTWTDGRQVAPMLPHPPPVVRCSHCHHLFWLRQAEKIGSILSVVEPSEQDYYSAIAAGLAKGTEEEKTLRILAWWRTTNTAVRRAGLLGALGGCYPRHVKTWTASWPC